MKVSKSVAPHSLLLSSATSPTPIIVGPLWHTFVTSLGVYERSSIEGVEDSYDGRSDSDGAEKSLESFVIQLFEFLLTIVGIPKFVRVVMSNVKELVYYTIGFLQMTEQQVARRTKIISPNTEDAKYVINVKQIAKFVVGLGDKVSPTDIEEGMGVGCPQEYWEECRKAEKWRDFSWLRSTGCCSAASSLASKRAENFMWCCSTYVLLVSLLVILLVVYEIF